MHEPDYANLCQGYLEQWLEENTYDCENCGLQIVGEPTVIRVTPDEMLYYCPVCTEILKIGGKL